MKRYNHGCYTGTTPYSKGEWVKYTDAKTAIDEVKKASKDMLKAKDQEIKELKAALVKETLESLNIK